MDQQFEYRVVVRAFHPRMSLNKDDVADRSEVEIQRVVDSMSAGGWRLASTDTAINATGSAHVFLYFEREKRQG